MSDFPFLHVLETSLGANGTGTISLIVPNSEKLIVHGLRFVSTAGFNVTDIRTTDGKHYTNASNAVEIPSSMLGNAANGNNTILEFKTPLIVQGGLSLTIDLEDSSGSANSVTMLLDCIKETN